MKDIFSRYSALLGWYAIWIFCLWPFKNIDLNLASLIGYFWWFWLPILIIIAMEKRRMKNRQP